MKLFRTDRSFQVKQSSQNFSDSRIAYFELSHLEQGSAAWRSWRKKVIGASDAPTIMGENRFNSVSNLMNEKLGLQSEFGGNAATREGKRLEEFARKALEKEIGNRLIPTIIQDGSSPYIAASLDAITKDHSMVFEIKCGVRSYELAYKKHEIPLYYVGQLQHILMITQLQKITYAAYRPDSEWVTIEVKRNNSYISRLREAEEKFAASLVKRGHKLQDQFIGRPKN